MKIFITVFIALVTFMGAIQISGGNEKSTRSGAVVATAGVLALTVLAIWAW